MLLGNCSDAVMQKRRSLKEICSAFTLSAHDTAPSSLLKMVRHSRSQPPSRSVLSRPESRMAKSTSLSKASRSMANALEVRDLKASIDDLAILRGIDLDVPFGEVHAVMGPNGSGKSTLCHALMGKSDYTTSGSALVDGVEIIGLPIHERARAGLFEAFQYPTEIPGVTLDELTDAMAEAAGTESTMSP